MEDCGPKIMVGLVAKRHLISMDWGLVGRG